MPRSVLAHRPWRGSRVPAPPPSEPGRIAKLRHDLDTGAGERTPWLLLAGVLLVIVVAAGVIMTLSFLAYYLAS
jgi:hypothetical protein